MIRRALQRLKGCPFHSSPPGDVPCLGSKVDGSSSREEQLKMYPGTRFSNSLSEAG